MARKTKKQKIAESLLAAAVQSLKNGFDTLEIHCSKGAAADVTAAIDIVGNMFPGLMCDSKTVEEWEPIDGVFEPRFWIPIFPENHSQWDEVGHYKISPDHLYF